MAVRMDALARQQPDGTGITVPSWESLITIRLWKPKAEHLVAQQEGKRRWYETYQAGICGVEREYSFASPESGTTGRRVT